MFLIVNLLIIMFQNNSQLIEIQNEAFFSTQIKSLDVPSTVNKIHNRSFHYMNDLVEIFISSDKYYTDAKGIVWQRSPRALVFAPSCKTKVHVLNIGDIEEIFSGAMYFTQCNTLILNGIKRLGYETFKDSTFKKVIFRNCSFVELPKCSFFYYANLKSIHVPESVEKIGNSAFKNCYSLKKIVLSMYSCLRKVKSSSFNEVHLKKIIVPLPILRQL